MTFVVTDNCHKCRFTECVNVCPVECFHIDDNMTYINPKGCIDCGGCVPVCPVNAIYDEIALPEDLNHWVETNATKSAELPVISAPLSPLPGAEDRQNKLGFS